MSASQALMGLMGVQALTTAATSYASSKATRAAGDYQSSIAESNARIAEIQAQDAIRRGEIESKRIGEKGKRIVGAQRAALAAQGIEINTDDALDIQQDTAGITALDMLDTKNNAWREAWGYKVQSNQYSTQARYAKLTGKSQARQTLLTGGLSVARDLASSYYLSKSKSAWSLKDLIDEA